MNSDMDSLQQYRQRVSDDHEEIRIEAYHEIGDLGIPEGNEMLLQGLSDGDPLVCAAVRGILTEIADEKIIKMLLEILRAEDPGLRSQAMTVLSQLGHAALRQIEVYLKSADLALYEAKHAGKNTYRISERTDRSAGARSQHGPPAFSTPLPDAS